jgi:hypothetical protein
MVVQKEFRDRTLDWRLIGTYQASTGSPFTPIIGGDPLGSKSSDSFDVPNGVNSAACTSPVNSHQPSSYLKLQCFFALPTPVNLLGDLGRNSVTGPGLAKPRQLALQKIPISNGSRRRSPSRQESRSSTSSNHPNFAAPLDHPTVFDATGNYVNGTGQINTTTTPSRQMQLGVKVVWQQQRRFLGRVIK